MSALRRAAAAAEQIWAKDEFAFEAPAKGDGQRGSIPTRPKARLSAAVNSFWLQGAPDRDDERAIESLSRPFLRHIVPRVLDGRLAWSNCPSSKKLGACPDSPIGVSWRDER